MLLGEEVHFGGPPPISIWEVLGQDIDFREHFDANLWSFRNFDVNFGSSLVRTLISGCFSMSILGGLG